MKQLAFACGLLTAILLLGGCPADSEPTESSADAGPSGNQGANSTGDSGISNGTAGNATVADGSDAGVATLGVGTLKNGSSCATSDQCVSGMCAASASGMKYCYGTSKIGEPCKITQDCLGGACIESVCTEPADLLPNGSTCEDDTDCQSLNCGTSLAGDNFCYGDVDNGDPCKITQDCGAGICRSGVCIAPNSCVADAECAINAICNTDGMCQQVCGANALAVDDVCTCLSGFDWASSDPNDTNCVRLSVLPGCHIFAQDSQETYLGAVGGCYDSNSVCNEYGSYGSPYASDSIFNEYGTFGSQYASYSAFNPYSSSPPLLVCDGDVAGCVTVNDFACSGQTQVDPASLCSCP